MIGLAPPGRARSWQIAAALTAVHQAFPTDKVSVSRSTLGSDVLHIVVSSGAIEDSRELLTWRAIRPTPVRPADIPSSAGSSAAPGRNAVSTSGASPRSLSLSR